ncbi:Subunit ChlI of Mg-chelatase [Nocardia amikacinitolerans]|uniref:Subunit ChlI of Mg-chelatase n=1 Tax=Nocardia amikacinitolerans TaxID=756689 RepID=A0A285KNH5_9NOCA|nr:magnesium chelatase domain-containing protein [Nocardia amikacinitolerans]SNY74194.1 Subunit ChlI of Mg-chelatase [Nocardia amikacinitolerans]
MIDTFAWTAIETTDGGIDLALIAAGPARVPTPVAQSQPARPIAREVRDRVRAALANGDTPYPSEDFGVYRLCGCGDRSMHDLAVAVAVAQLAIAPPWAGLLDHVVFLAELGLDGSLRPGSPPVSAAALAALARAEFRYIVTAAPENTDDIDRIEGITVLTPTGLGEVVDWLTSLAETIPAQGTSPKSAGMPIAHRIGPARVRRTTGCAGWAGCAELGDADNC